MCADDGVVLFETFDFELLRKDMREIKECCGLTYAEIGEQCGCHAQSVYKFLSGAYSQLGKKLLYRFAWFVREHWADLFPDGQKLPDISKPRYRITYQQPRLPGL
jgi:hypothetical protein